MQNLSNRQVLWFKRWWQGWKVTTPCWRKDGAVSLSEESAWVIARHGQTDETKRTTLQDVVSHPFPTTTSGKQGGTEARGTTSIPHVRQGANLPTRWSPQRARLASSGYGAAQGQRAAEVLGQTLSCGAGAALLGSAEL